MRINAAWLCVTRERIRQIENIAISKLRKLENIKHLKDYLKEENAIYLKFNEKNS